MTKITKCVKHTAEKKGGVGGREREGGRERGGREGSEGGTKETEKPGERY